MTQRVFLVSGARKRPALTGMIWLVDSDAYPDKLAGRGLALERPNPAERYEINRIIMDELVKGVFTPDAIGTFQQIVGV